MFTFFRLLHIVCVALRYRLDELVLSGIKHPLAYGLLRIVRFGRPPKVPRGVRLRLALESRSEEHTSELQSLMRISYAVFCLKKKNKKNNIKQQQNITYDLVRMTKN